VINTRDTFLHFLADNLAGITIHPIRFEKDVPDTSTLQVNAVNVNFLHPRLDVHVSSQLVSIDILHESELTAVDWAEQLARLMQKAAKTPKLNYTVPLSPVATGTDIYWDTEVRFRPVVADYYFHLSATVLLHHRFS